ncbi:ABC transporter substrate-binding protein [Coleofasciculus sp. FACHB-SPT36]|uniref:ABC transporter substrate-binding protein n=1 Tax=Cyanophyceae TaxID=3028117 RepID=UPI00168A9049|nr:ABC transporter substrate-binding protein [Coleofasciculus sp. FACHB-SPT36]MBD2541850.1 ABC transporter substrate-binding protein [Coleofasciculus sp. FACHB-SPT36]
MKLSATIPLIWRRLLALMLAMISAIALHSCSLNQFNTKAAQVPQLVDSILQDPKTFNYVLSQESPNVFSLIYEGLISENGNGELEGALAESWEVAPDKKRIVFTMREGLKWSDGQPLTVDDVIFTYNELYFNEKIPTDIRDILKIGKDRLLPTVRKLDERRVEFTVPEPFAPFLRYTGLAILPAHALRESIVTTDSDGKPKFLSSWGIDTDPKKIIVNGMYQLENYQTSERVTFRRNPYYWRKDTQGNQQPYIDRIVWQIVENTDTSFIQYRSGGLDTLGIAPEYYSLLKQEENRGKFKIYTGGPELSTTFLVFNLNKAKNSQNQPLVDPIKSRWFNKLEFRQAVAHAIDRQKMLNNLYRGLGEPQNSPIYKQSPYYLSPEQGLKVYDYNPEKAKELLRKAGFKYNPQGQLFDADGNRVRFSMLTNSGNKLREAIGAQIKEDLGAVGIQVDFNAINFNTLIEKVYTQRKWDSYIGKIGGGGIEPNGGANTWTTKGGLHTFNLGPQAGEPPLKGWEVDDWELAIENLYIKGASELDESKRREIYVESQRITQENLPFIYLVNPLSMEAVRDRVQGVKFSALGGAFWNLYELKVAENKNIP